MHHLSSEYELLDTNTSAAVSDPVDVNGYHSITAYIEPVSGTHATHVVQVEISADPDAIDNPGTVQWFSPSGTSLLQAPTYVTFEDNAEAIRFRVSAPEGAPSQCNVKVIAS